MIYKIAAELTVLIHFLFICFVISGGFFAIKYRWLVYLHIPCAVWGALIEFKGWICPLTPLEFWFRERSGRAGYNTGFIEHYLIPIIYPAGLTREIQIFLGMLVIVLNVIAYGLMIYISHKMKKSK